MKRTIPILLTLLLVSSLLASFTIAMASGSTAGNLTRQLTGRSEKIDPQIRLEAASGAPQMLPVIVTLVNQADLHIPGLDRAARQQEVILRLMQAAEASKASLQGRLQGLMTQGQARDLVPFWIFNGFSIAVTPAALDELASWPEVAWITPDSIDILPALAVPEANLAAVNAPALWDLGLTGQGVVVASMDSGVDAGHPDLAPRFRGGSNSWFDPYGQHASPFDATGHGTQVMGVMVGGDAGGTSIGMAPQAQWIAVKIFNDSGSATASAIHLGYQWILDPDGNPLTADAPHVVNNSWAFGAPGCNLEFQLDLQALRSASILPVFSAGNYGPNSGTSTSPANYPEAFAVGATSNSDSLYGYSSRGPSACGEAQSIYPELVAPGVSIRSTSLGGSYTSASGTSLAAPHVSGALALLLGAFPDLTAGQQQAALLNGAVDLGISGPDNSFGYGRLDVQASYAWLQAGGSAPTPTPAPLPTATPTPTPVTKLHVGDLDGSRVLGSKSWTATVTILVHDAAERPLANATVAGKWSNGATGTVTCLTNASGLCSVSKSGLKNTTASVKFSVTGITHAALAYQAASNHDPDGDSTGSAITVSR